VVIRSVNQTSPSGTMTTCAARHSTAPHPGIVEVRTDEQRAGGAQGGEHVADCGDEQQ